MRTTTMSDDPWRDIDAPRDSPGFNARRIADVGSRTWGLYWGVDRHRQCLLILQHDATEQPSQRVPRLRGLRVEIQETDQEGRALLVLRLMAGEHRDLFYRLCTDIVAATSVAESGEEALSRMVVRTWRWHRLLRSGRDGRLSREEQMGLIGELLVLEQHLMPVVGAADGVRAWVGPVGDPRDFRIGSIGVEAKARTPLAPGIRISSAEQLDSTDAARLFLHVADVGEAAAEADAGETVADVVRRVHDAVAARDLSAVGDFEDRLSAVGFEWSDDYSDYRWMITDTSVFEVVAGFPRLTPSGIPSGVHEVRYGIDVTQCEAFRVPAEDLRGIIDGENDGD